MFYENVSYAKENQTLREALIASDIVEQQQDEAIGSLTNLVEESKPKWWQNPIAIVVYIGLAFATGIMVAL